ncbi:MAG: hypothetical protein KI793_13180 [Rivularia sp. (in: Bacteria)]|nr:hypothetical protein [Rivularia sp. MS3]
MNNSMKKLAVLSILMATPLLWLLNNQVSATPKQNVANSIYSQAKPAPAKWRRMNQKQELEQIKSIINHRMGVAALNQLALEGFIGYDCQRSFYFNELYGNLQTLMRVKCNSPRGASSAIGYDEIRVIFNRFESNIEDFKIERVSKETGSPKTKLPD